ncbi:hypothetical protein ElyMa_003021700 [Elysia marginata]|uniref:DNA-directed DNA polymerase n=1 Tax=Elysia marginata TaxID=1093978 RepID=A0AAV4II34_9GAST|nr:hypothetical protein ElyMa_003021700 [Elysia marginata]
MKWVNSIDDQISHNMITFDICNFYPSITEKLRHKSLLITSNYVAVSKDEIDIITHAKRTTLYKDGQPWCMTGSNFDVTMGSFDRAETWELVGLYLLSQLQHLDIKVGLYRDDGLAVTNKSPQQTEKNNKRKICAIFRDNGLNITIQANQKIVDFLGSTFNLYTGLSKPYKNPNDRITYIHRESNHPPSIIKNLPQGIDKRLTILQMQKSSKMRKYRITRHYRKTNT